jgi:hypothetical protein
MAYQRRVSALKQRLDHIDGQFETPERSPVAQKGTRNPRADMMQQYHETMDKYLQQEKEQGKV